MLSSVGRASPCPQIHSASEDQLIERARALLPCIANRAPGANAARSVPVETIDEFRDAGFFRLLQPRAYGGMEGDYGTLVRVVETIARGCASSAWVLGILMEHAWVVGAMSKRAQDDVWGADADALVAASFAPVPIESVEGGYRVTGQWSWFSGCEHADWVFIGGIGARGPVTLLVPIAEVTLLDDWHVLGLRASGSRTITFDNVFVPAYRTAAMSDLGAGTPPGVAVHPDNYLCRAPRGLLAPFTFTPVLLGLAQHALDIAVETLKDKKSPAGRVADQVDVQLAIGTASAEIELIRWRVLAAVDSQVAAMRVGHTIDEVEVQANGRDLPVFAQRLRAVVESLCNITGTQWVRDDHPLQTIFRDVVTASNHAHLKPSMGVQAYGRMLLGFGTRML